MSVPPIHLEHVTVTYADEREPALREVNLAVDEGELTLVVGRTGSGKSTLLNVMCGSMPHFTGGHLAGRVLIGGRDTRTHRPRDLSDVVGVVGQDPLAGFATDTVEEELAYAMEQLGLPTDVMRKRVEETLDLLGIADLRGAALRELSGGQQQRVAIGSVLTAHPRILILDEPTSALDPTGAEEVLATITRLVHDLAVTVVVAEHRIERVIQYADSVIEVSPEGFVAQGDPASMMQTCTVAPPVVELGRWAGWQPLPLSVRDARRRAGALREALAHARDSAPTNDFSVNDGRVNDSSVPHPAPPYPTTDALRASGVVVRHGDVVAVAGVDLTLRGGEVTALMGRNGAGKSSLLWAMQGTGSIERGSVQELTGPKPQQLHQLSAAQRRRRVALVPQTASDLLYLGSVDAECRQADLESGFPTGRCAELLESLAPGIPGERHPRDLSEGQRLALVLAVQLVSDPPVLLLDEPTRGLDYAGKSALRDVLRRLAAHGRSITVSTHDVEFAAATCDRVVVMAAGEIVADGPTASVLTSSPAFAPQISKITAPGPWLTLEDLTRALPQGAP